MIKQHLVFSTHGDYRFTMTRAEGSYVWDDQGHKLLDFVSGWNVTNLGWNHPEVNEAFMRQAKKNMYAAMWTPDPIQFEYAEALTAAYPGMDTAIRTTGGTEANEVAIKLARAATGRTKIIGFKNTYHGQLFAAMALGYIPEYVKGISPLVPDFVQLDYPAAVGDETKDKATLATSIAQLEATLANKDVAAIVLEPGIITGWGSCRMAPEGFMEAVRALTTKYGTLMVVDEVGTGFSRVGALFGIQHYDVVPDIATLAKGITNGAGGLGAVLSRAELIEPTIPKANYVSTFGWMPTACAAALQTLAVHKRDKVWENAAGMGERLQASLRKQLDSQGVVVRGRALEVCVDLTAAAGYQPDTAEKVEHDCRKNGLSVIQGDDGCLQLMPPCTISQADLDRGVDILASSIMSQL